MTKQRPVFGVDPPEEHRHSARILKRIDLHREAIFVVRCSCGLTFAEPDYDGLPLVSVTPPACPRCEPERATRNEWARPGWEPAR